MATPWMLPFTAWPTMSQAERDVYILGQEDHICSDLFNYRDPPALPGFGGIQSLAWFESMWSSLPPRYTSFLEEACIFLPGGICRRPIHWPLIGAALERWNPRTHTFFFSVGEMSIFLEDIPQYLGADRGGDLRLPTCLPTMPSDEDILWRLSPSEDRRITLLRSGDLNLFDMWVELRSFIGSDLPDDIRRVKFGLLLVVCGLFYFPSGPNTIDMRHVALLERHFYRRGGSLAQPILAYLYEGMDSAARGGRFFGSHYLLIMWLEAHFPFSVRNTSITSSGQGVRILRHSVKLTREDYRRCFDSLTDVSFFAGSEESEVLTPVAAESTCILIGVHSFVLYSVHRCIRQLFTDCSLPVHLSHVVPVEHRSLGAEEDRRRIRDVLLHWRHHTDTTLVASSLAIGNAGERETEYLAWMGERAPRCPSLSEREHLEMRGMGGQLDLDSLTPSTSTRRRRRRH